MDYPAFPHPVDSDESYWPGLTLRDYFAAQALQGFITKGFGPADDSSKVAGWCYNYADAMLKARDGK